MINQQFKVYIPFSNDQSYPNLVKGFFQKGEFIEDRAGDTYFQNPQTGAVGETWILSGIASTTNVDRDRERMSEKALRKMKDVALSKGINIFGNHEHNWENTLGVIKNSELLDGGQKWKIDALLDSPVTNSKIPMLINKKKTGINLALSIGGRVLSTYKEFDKALGDDITVIDDLEPLEVSIVGIAANGDCDNISISAQIAKSAKLGESKMTTKKIEEDEKKTDESKEEPKKDEKPKEEQKGEPNQDTPTGKPTPEGDGVEWKPADEGVKYIELSEDKMIPEEVKISAMLKLMGNYKILRSGEPKLPNEETKEMEKPVETEEKPEEEMKSAKKIAVKAYDSLQKNFDDVSKKFEDLSKNFEKAVKEGVDGKMKDRATFLKSISEFAPVTIDEFLMKGQAKETSKTAEVELEKKIQYSY